MTHSHPAGTDGQSPTTWRPALPRPGDVVLLDRTASVQFATVPIRFRVIGIDPRPTYRGWVWLVGYQLDHRGEAVANREVFVRLAGVSVPRVLPGG